MFNKNEDICWICDEKIKYEDSCAIGLFKQDISVGNFDIKIFVHNDCFLEETDIKKIMPSRMCYYCSVYVHYKNAPPCMIVRFNGRHQWFHQDCWMKNIGVDLEEI